MWCGCLSFVAAFLCLHAVSLSARNRQKEKENKNNEIRI